MEQNVILFDLDGTLTDSGEGIIKSVVFALEHFGLSIPSAEELRSVVGPPLHGSLARYGVPPQKLEEGVAVFRSRYNPIGIYENAPYPGIREMLAALKRSGFRLCIATSKPEEMANRVLMHFDLAQFFDTVCGATMDESRSSKSDVIAWLLEQNGRADNMIMVGDTKFDVLGAAAHGIPTIGVAWGYGDTAEMKAAGAAAIADSPEKLLQLLQSNQFGGIHMDLTACVNALKPRLISALQENLRIPSVQGEPEAGAPYGRFVRESLDHALNTARELGFRTKNMDGHVGWCEYGEGEEMVVVLGHLDVVPAGDGWSREPFGGELLDGKIWGRGATDDKGPALAALYALAALRDAGLPIRRRVRVLFGCNEETGSADMEYYLAHGGEIPVMGFTPDGGYPVINGEKGIITAAFSRSYVQSGDIRLISIRGGTASNVVPACAQAKLACPAELARRISGLHAPHVRFTAVDGGLLVEAQGKSAHGSTPEQGENAIGRLLLALDTLPLAGELAQAVHFLAQTIGMETDGTGAGIALQDAVSGKLTLNLGVIDGDEHRLTLKINYRYPVTLEYADCAPILNQKFADAGFTLDSEFHRHKLYIPEDSPLISALLKVYREKTGLDGTPESIGGGTYAKSLPNIVAFGPVFPGDEVREHMPDEYITVDNLMRNAQIIAAAMYELAK